VGKLNQDHDRLHLALTDVSQGRMGDFYLSPDQMLDVQLTQRLLSFVAGYRGQAGLDTAVISTRQPLSTLEGAM
jgi:general secretion pathway protein N